MGGRIVDVAVVEKKPRQMYLATASGGLWKTVNNGTTWTPVFEHENTASLGAVAVAPSNPEIVWVGTGEANPRNSVGWGDGVYQSTDGGRRWQHRGLRETAHIGRIVIHPTNPDVVYVAALGRLWGPNKQRGIYRTRDGGRHWRLVLFLDEDTGCIDLALDPDEPETVYAAAYQCRRDTFAGGNPRVQCGPLAGLYKSTNGGDSWDQMTQGLPQRPLGRCGLAVCRTDSNVLYAIIQTDKTDLRTIPGQSARTNSQPDTGGVFRSGDKGQTWTKVNDLCPRPFYFGQIRVDPNDPARVYVLGLALHVSTDGGKTFRSDGARLAHPDHHALWIDPQDSDHLVLGGDGGVYFSYDRGANWQHQANLPIAQFYEIAVDQRRPYRIYGGLQDNGTWSGPSATHSPDGITNADWVRLLVGDGFHCQPDPAEPDVLYAEGQYGLLQRVHLRTGRVVAIRPPPPPSGPGDRFNWNAPLLLSPHDSHTLYFGGNRLFRSVDRGDHWQAISPDLSRGKPGPSADFGHTLTALAESPCRSDLLFAGTDDGRVHVTRNGGRSWTEVSDRILGLPPSRWISRLECSHFDVGTTYLALDRHRQDDRRPYLFRTTDCGATWQPLADSLPPEGPVHVIREDPHNRDLLFVGTEFGLYVSVNGGVGWQRFGGLPTVAVRDLVIQPRDRELVIATHGRSLFVVDIAPLEYWTPAVLAADNYLFPIKPATAFELHGSHGRSGAGQYAVANPPAGAVLSYYLKADQAKPVQIRITDSRGDLVALLEGARERGLHRLIWDLHRMPSEGDDNPGPRVPPGEYVVGLKAGKREGTQTLRVEAAE
jgi:photosystem II stability/assembly factor-like uncharacterized protein